MCGMWIEQRRAGFPRHGPSHFKMPRSRDPGPPCGDGAWKGNPVVSCSHSQGAQNCWVQNSLGSMQIPIMINEMSEADTEVGKASQGKLSRV